MVRVCECDRSNMGTPAVDSAGTPTSPMKHSFNVQSDSSDSDDEVTVPSTFSRKISTNKRLDKSVSSVDTRLLGVDYYRIYLLLNYYHGVKLLRARSFYP